MHNTLQHLTSPKLQTKHQSCLSFLSILGNVLHSPFYASAAHIVQLMNMNCIQCHMHCYTLCDTVYQCLFICI